MLKIKKSTRIVIISISIFLYTDKDSLTEMVNVKLS